MVIRKIFEGVSDDEVHNDFLKYSRGNFKDKYLLEGKKQSDKWSIKAGAEFANYLVKKCLEKVSGNISAKGIIVSTSDLSDEIKFPIKKKSNFQGVRKLEIETEISSEELRSLMERYPRVFYALTFKGDDFDLKIKAKAPKSGKPGKESEDGPKADFCTLKTNDKTIVEDLFFDSPNFKEIKISHVVAIEGIVYPKDMTKLKPEEVREQSKRKGKITRISTIDGKEVISEKDFIA